MSRTVNIIGAGPGGLACAMLLANAGLRVRVIERLPVPGGRTSTITTPEGFRFDLGPDLFPLPAGARRNLRRLRPRPPAGGRDGSARPAVSAGLRGRRRTARHARHRPDGGGGGPALAGRPRARSRGSWSRPARSSSGSPRSWSSPSSRWRDLANPDLLKLMPLLKPWRSLDAELGSFFSDERIRLAFTFQSKYLGMSPFRCPSLFSILSFLEYEHGVFHPIGGCGAVSTGDGPDRRGDGRRDPLRGAGRVDWSLPAGGSPRSDTPEGRYEADATVVNADFARSMTTARARRPPPALERPPDRLAAVLLLDLHALPRHRGPLRRRGPSQHLPLRGLPAESGRHRAPAYALGRPVDVCPERLRHRPDARPGRHEHALPADPGHPSASQRRLAAGRRRASARWPSTRWSGSASRASGSGSATRRCSRPTTGRTATRSTGAPPSTSPTTSARCSTCGPTTGSRTSSGCISSAAARIPAAACR